MPHGEASGGSEAWPLRIVYKCNPRRHGGAGALWDIWPVQSKPVLRRYLTHRIGEFLGEDGQALTSSTVRVSAVQLT